MAEITEEQRALGEKIISLKLSFDRALQERNFAPALKPLIQMCEAFPQERKTFETIAA
jgi:hypothetical protein